VIRHVSVITFVDDVSEAEVAAIEAALAELPARLPQLRAYTFGRDLVLADTNASFAVVADFDDIAGYEAYRGDPEHQRILAELIKPLMSARAAVQYEIS